MIKEPNELKLVYNEADSSIIMETYDEGFLRNDLDITDAVTDLVIEKLFNDTNCPLGGGILQLERTRTIKGNVEKIIGTIIKTPKN